jgi:hypothetical protein
MKRSELERRGRSGEQNDIEIGKNEPLWIEKNKTTFFANVT